MEKSISWVEKHRPKSFHEVRGQQESVSKFKEALSKIENKKHNKKAILLHGPPGTGKTTLAYVVANETNSEIFELNASDLRNSAKLKEILKPAMEQMSLVKSKKIILVDEVDGISSVDRGGLTELLRMIEKTSFPVVITANDIWGKKFSDLRKKTEIIQLKAISYYSIKDVLINILRKEGKFIDNEIITEIAVNAKGDLRAAINDLQTIINLPKEHPIQFDERNKEIDIFNAMKTIFKSKPDNSLLSLFDSIDMQIDDILLWLEENIPLEYQGEELARAYELLSRSDIFRRRIYRQQYWRFLVYKNAFLSYGISSAKNLKKSPSQSFTSYKKPSRILKMWINNRRIEKKKSIAKKYASYVHIGEKRALREFPTIKQFLLKPEVQKELKLTEEEITYLNK